MTMRASVAVTADGPDSNIKRASDALRQDNPAWQSDEWEVNTIYPHPHKTDKVRLMALLETNITGNFYEMFHEWLSGIAIATQTTFRTTYSDDWDGTEIVAYIGPDSDQKYDDDLADMLVKYVGKMLTLPTNRQNNILLTIQTLLLADPSYQETLANIFPGQSGTSPHTAESNT